MDIWHYLCLFFVVLIGTYILLLIFEDFSKKYKSLQNTTDDKYTFSNIVKTLDSDITYVFEIYFRYDLLTEVIVSKNILGTDELKESCNDIFVFFTKFYPKKEYRIYNKILNGELDSLIIKIIYNKLINFNNNINSSVKQNNIKF